VIRLFAGYDPRETVGFHVFSSSVVRRATQPVSITALHLPSLVGYTEKHTDGSNAFIYSRFLVPWLCEWKGFAIFADGSDMLCRADIAELWNLCDPMMAVQVVKHDYQTRFTKKYIGTKIEAKNEDYPRKNWSSLMVINCGHMAWRDITPKSVETMTGSQLHRFEFIPDRFIGELPTEWNHLVTENPHNPRAKIIHYTLGIPAFDYYRYSPHADHWRAELSELTRFTD
jgi:lipopolysaccharide biosynthesis glycosyltransferase